MLNNVTIRDLGLIVCIAGVADEEDAEVAKGLKQLGLEIRAELEELSTEEQNEFIKHFVELADKSIFKFNEVKIKLEGNDGRNDG
jgi:translation elongation factor EF-1beta